MHSRTNALVAGLLFCATVCGASNFTFHIAGDEPGAWPKILSSVGFIPANGGPANLFVVRAGATGSGAQWIQRIEQGACVVVEGQSELGEALGFKAAGQFVVVRSIVDLRSPKLPIVWEKAVRIPVFNMPDRALIFARERWEGAPVMAAVRRGAGTALWVAVPPGDEGYERFPYLLQALADLGVSPPFRSARLWAFFDSAYRSRVDLDYFAQRWRKAGIGALHVAAWHYFESEPQNDAYLRELIETCHRNGILVYAWMEFPHVSERFWAEHPEWREKTALLQDAQLDWRKLMNLRNRDAFAAVARGTKSLIDRFDWDGVNLAELYFESLEGAANPARFTPMNDDVRAEFRQQHGFDPIELFQKPPEPERLRAFLEYRADLARRQQLAWVEQMEEARARKPDLDLVLTHVDDRFDTRMRDLIGADAAKVLPLLEQHDFTFLIEDPATIWNLGSRRYPQIAARYEPLTARTDKLAIDINVTERYQDVYPAKQQTGTELFQLVHVASNAFPRVALYFENSILPPDLPLLAASAAEVDQAGQDGSRLNIRSRHGVGVPWQGPAQVDGRPWPVRDAETVWLPAGSHVVEPAQRDAAVRIVDFNGDLRSASASSKGLTISYQSAARALAILSIRPSRVEIDGAVASPLILESGKGYVLVLPRGQHFVEIE
jgi:hypothetical protein